MSTADPVVKFREWLSRPPTDVPHVWALPPEPGPDVRRLRPVERYRGDNGIWLDREPDNSGWRLVVMNRPADEALEWIRAYGLGAATCWGGRPLLDATSEVDREESR